MPLSPPSNDLKLMRFRRFGTLWAAVQVKWAGSSLNPQQGSDKSAPIRGPELITAG